MNDHLQHKTQEASASRAFARVFVAGLARRMAKAGLLRTLARAIFGFDSSDTTFPSQHLHIQSDSWNLKPLRRSGVAAGGAGGGGPGDIHTANALFA